MKTIDAEALEEKMETATTRRRAILRLGAGGATAALLSLAGSGRAGAHGVIALSEEHESAMPRPTDGWTLHVAAKKHFPAAPERICHHFCRPVANGFTQCQLYDGDDRMGALVGSEVIVDAATYAGFDNEEKKLWHSHKTEIPKVEATLPDLPPDEAAEVVKALEETYGKLYLFWDPGAQELPVGQPFVPILG